MGRVDSFTSFVLFDSVSNATLTGRSGTRLAKVLRLFLSLINSVIHGRHELNVKSLIQLSRSVGLTANLRNVNALSTIIEVNGLLRLLGTLSMILNQLATNAKTEDKSNVNDLSRGIRRHIKISVNVVNLSHISSSKLLTVATNGLNTGRDVQTLGIIISNLTRIIRGANTLNNRGVRAGLKNRGTTRIKGLGQILRGILAGQNTMTGDARNLSSLKVRIISANVRNNLLTNLTRTLLGRVNNLIVRLLSTNKIGAAINGRILGYRTNNLAASQVRTQRCGNLKDIVGRRVSTKRLLGNTGITALTTSGTALRIVKKGVRKDSNSLNNVINNTALGHRKRGLLNNLITLNTSLLLKLASSNNHLINGLTTSLIRRLLIDILTHGINGALRLKDLLNARLLGLTETLLSLANLTKRLVLTLVRNVITTVRQFLTLRRTIFRHTGLTLALLVLNLNNLLILSSLFLDLRRDLFFRNLNLALDVASRKLYLHIYQLGLFINLIGAALLNNTRMNGNNSNARGRTGRHYGSERTRSFL